MILIRYFVLAVLVYLLYYLISSLVKKHQNNVTEVEADSAIVNDILVEDPVCHKLLPREQALRSKVDGEIVYFCSEECCEIYEKNHEEKE
ncbi:hypothetical protein [Desulfotalea psychrophila]|uniref:TRASH domain-containing protein n=1 Tax=Desulfotalea psychrophila (strain LSv54 / DSM 12343) TaxID=177439 RepID=Q6AR66_DESPS|nr:hypothetical protein [Desulfotalea psychrophila]CAG35158.1 hypothetical protein DP0429 [Desulfotalea psychrophila LSv54]